MSLSDLLILSDLGEIRNEWNHIQTIIYHSMKREDFLLVVEHYYIPIASTIVREQAHWKQSKNVMKL